MIIKMGSRVRNPSMESFNAFLDKNSFEILAYTDDLCVLCEGKNQLINIIKIIEKWTILNKINIINQKVV